MRAVGELAHGPRRARSTSPYAGTLLVSRTRREVAMPRPWKAFIFPTALLAATPGLTSLASAHTDNVTALRLTTVEVESHLVDVAPTGGTPSLGDTLLASDHPLRHGPKVGF